MVLFLNLSITQGFDFNYPLYKTIVFTIIITTLFSLWAFSPKADVILAAIFVAIVVTIYIKDKKTFAAVLSFIGNMLSWAKLYVSGFAKYSDAYAPSLLLCIYIITSFTMAFLIIRWRRTFIPIVIAISVFIVQWYGFVDESLYYMLSFAAVCAVFLALRAYERQKEIKSSTALINWIGIASVISAAAIAMTMLMPANIKPVTWQWLNDKVVQTFPLVRELRGGDRSRPLASVDLSNTFDLSDAGMQRSQKHLGGPAMETDGIAFIVHSSQKFYLRAVAYDIYTGHGWQRSPSKWFAYPNNASLDNSFARDVKTYKTKLTIEPASLHTNTLFAPWQPLSVSLQGGGQYYANDAYEMINPSKSIEKPYTIESIVPIVDADKLRASGYDYPSNIINKYLQLPKEMITGRLKQEALDVTMRYDNPYDKVKALEAYLRQFPYTLDMPDTPQDQEFVDYFLFEEKQGYCVYYATAMTVMARSIGIPARYVTGFIMPDEPIEGDSYQVDNSRAHSWVEVYFNNFGWLAFEPTPAYEAGDLTDDASSTPSTDDNYNNYYQQQYQDYMSGLNQSVGDEQDLTQNSVGLTSEESSQADHMSNWLLALIIAAAVAIILVARITFVWIKRKRLDAAMQKAGYRDAIIAYYANICDLLNYQQLNIWPGETPSEYAERISRYIEGSDFKELTNIFQKARYSQLPLSMAELHAMADYYRYMLKTLREKPKLYMKYVWHRYLLDDL